MTTVNVNVTDVAGAYGPNDKVVFYSPVYREGSSGEIISTAQAVFSLQGGPGTVELEPGPVRVKFQVQGISDIKDKEGVVPDTGPVDLYDVIGSSLIYTPPVVNRALEIIHAERDTLLDEMATTVSEAVDGELGDAVRSAQTAATTAAQAATSADGRATSAENKVDSYTPRVVALEAMGGLTPESPVDGQTANLVQQPTTLTRAALATHFAATQTVDQPDYVEMMASRSTYSSMELVKETSAGALSISCLSPSGEFVRYGVTGTSRYQYVSTVAVSSDTAETREIYFSEFTTTGVFHATTTTPYTAEVGATITVQVVVVEPSTIQAYTFTDNRGGIWEFTVQDTPALSATVSTWASSGTSRRTTLFTLPAGIHTIVGEFLGADPENPPANSATARGWLGSLMGGSLGGTLSVPNHLSVGGTATLSPTSNKDFALRMRPAGTSANFEFVPYHGTESEAQASPPRYFNAGQEIDIATLTVGQAVPIDSFEIVQHIYGRNSSAPDPTQNIAEVWTSQKITPDGRLLVAGRWRALVDCEMSESAYTMMLMGSMPIFDEVISSVGTSHPISSEGGARYIWLTEESDTAKSYAMLSSTSDYVAAVSVDSRRESLRAGASDKPATKAFIEMREGGAMAKVYQRGFGDGTIVPAGAVQRFSGSYWYGAIPGIRQVLTLT